MSSGRPDPKGAYLHRADYWVLDQDQDQHPVRQGDLFGGTAVDGVADQWPAAMVIHPTCELSKVDRVQVARVRPLSALPDAFQRSRVAAGVTIKSDGVIQIAFAHTFFLAPVGFSALSEPMFANFREIGLAARHQFTQEARVGALTHDARVTLIRRYLYFRFRSSLPYTAVRDLEAQRIGRDPHFAGPRPSWAPLTA